ncbi:MAG: hypothetical protein WCO08_02685 [Actinomycetes bacterium]
MKIKSVAAVSVAGLVLVLAGCGGAAKVAAPTDTASQTSAAEPTGSFGSVVTLSGGVTVTVAAPTSFKPGQFATNFFAGNVANKMSVTVHNGGSAALDLTTMVIDQNSGTNACVDINDGDNGINGVPSDPVAANASATFAYGVGCSAKVGDPLTLVITLGSSSATITGKLV